MNATIRVNGEARRLTAMTLETLLIDEGLDVTARGLAVARNGTVAPRASWAATSLEAGDEIEIVKAVRGG